MTNKLQRTYRAVLPFDSSNEGMKIAVAANFVGSEDDWHRAKITLAQLFEMKESFQQLFFEKLDPRRSYNVVSSMRKWEQSNNGLPAPFSKTEVEHHQLILERQKALFLQNTLDAEAMPSLEAWPTELGKFPFNVAGTGGEPDSQFDRYLRRVAGPHLFSIVVNDIGGLVSISLDISKDAPSKGYKTKEERNEHRKFPWYPILVVLSAFFFIYEVWFSGNYSGNYNENSGGMTCRTQLEQCLEAQPENRWESYCQPRYYRCLNR